jgi:hypothetical protein
MRVAGFMAAKRATQGPCSGSRLRQGNCPKTSNPAQ